MSGPYLLLVPEGLLEEDGTILGWLVLPLAGMPPPVSPPLPLPGEPVPLPRPLGFTFFERSHHVITSMSTTFSANSSPGIKTLTRSTSASHGVGIGLFPSPAPGHTHCGACWAS